MNKPAVLVIDDERDIRKLLTIMLGRQRATDIYLPR